MAKAGTATNSSYFTPRSFRFLRDLTANNNRDWFQANKERYETDLKDPFLRFIADFSGPLEKINRHFIADPRPNGGSMMRIYRDIRLRSPLGRCGLAIRPSKSTRFVPGNASICGDVGPGTIFSPTPAALRRALPAP